MAKDRNTTDTEIGDRQPETSENLKPPDIDRGYAWVVLGATYFSFFICGGFLMTTGIVYTALLTKFGDSVAKTAWAGSVFTAATSLLAPVGSLIVDLQSCRVAVMIGGCLVTLGFLLTAFAPNIEFCIFSYGLIAGSGGGITFSVLFVIMGFNFKDRLNLAQGIAVSGTGLGLFLLAPVLEASKSEFGYTGLCIIMSAIAMQMIVCGALMRPSTLELQVKQIRQQKLPSVEDSDKISKPDIHNNTYRQALLDPFVILLSLSMFFYCGGLYTLTIHWPNAILHKGFTSMQSSYILSIVGFISIFGRVCTGIIANLRCITNRMVYCGSTLTFGIALMLFFLYSKSYIGNIVLAVVVGLANGSPYVVITAFTAEGAGVQFLAAAVGMEFLFGGVSSILIPVLSGYMLQAGLSYDVIFASCGVCLIASGTLAFVTKFVSKRTQGKIPTVYIDIIPEKETLIVYKQPEVAVESELHENKRQGLDF